MEKNIQLNKSLKDLKIENKNIKLFFNKKYPDGTKRKIVDNKIIKKLGWNSKITLEQGLLKTINWYKKNNKYLYKYYFLKS